MCEDVLSAPLIKAGLLERDQCSRNMYKHPNVCHSLPLTAVYSGTVLFMSALFRFEVLI